MREQGLLLGGSSRESAGYRNIVSEGAPRIKDDTNIGPGSGYGTGPVVSAGRYVNRGRRFHTGFLSIKDNFIFKLVFWRYDQAYFITLGMAMDLSIGVWRGIDVLYQMYCDMQRGVVHQHGIHQQKSFEDLFAGV